jgi:hypothetical protein
MQDFNGETLLLGDRVAFINHGVLCVGYVRGEHMSGAIKIGIDIGNGYFLICVTNPDKVTILSH